MNQKLSRIIRRTHMYLALFLMPWLAIYALSGLLLNHPRLFAPGEGQQPGAPQFERVKECEFDAAFSAEADARMIGAQVLEFLGLPGSFNVQGTPKQPKLVISRNAAFTVHRVTYFRDANRLLVERQVLPARAFLHRSHFRHGYQQPFAAALVWGAVVDVTVAAMVFWVASGVWMWWEIKPARTWGAISVLLGLGLFGLLLATI